MLILIRGGGDLASGIAVRLVKSGFEVVITELAEPLTVRRAVSFAEAVDEIVAYFDERDLEIKLPKPGTNNLLSDYLKDD